MFTERYNDADYDNDDYYINDDIVDYRDYSDVSDKSIDFAECLLDILQNIIDDENNLDEEFVSQNCAQRHFNIHCLRNISHRKSSRQNVYYDFVNINDYINREDYVDHKIKSSKNIVYDLVDTDIIIKYFHKLFEGNQTINFDISCGLFNNNGRVSISINSWANKATNNYFKNTVDYVVQTPSGKTITMFPVDANYLENKINSKLTECGFTEIHYNK